MTGEFFRGNREKIAEQVQGGLIVLSAYTLMQRGNDVAFLLEQESNFWWLTGIEYPDWWVIIDGTRHKTWLVQPKVGDIQDAFDGSLSADEALRLSAADEVISEDEAFSMLRHYAKKHSMVYTLGEYPYVEYFHFHLNPALKKMRESLERIFGSVQDCRKELNRLRAIKQPEEIVATKKAIHLTIDAFEHVRQTLDTYRYEYEIEAEFSYYFRKNGSNHAYDPIVACGKNASTIHHMKNNGRLKKRELVLFDIGARHDGYAADITRTYAYGEPTKRQRQVYNALQAAQTEIVSLIAPHMAVEQYQKQADAIMKKVLVELGLMQSVTDSDNYRKYYPHAVSHGLGVDVHDSLGAPKYFLPNMVLTVEPGVYIPEEGIGVRIEDDILVTDKGHVNLSARLSTEL